MLSTSHAEEVERLCGEMQQLREDKAQDQHIQGLQEQLQRVELEKRSSERRLCQELEQLKQVPMGDWHLALGSSSCRALLGEGDGAPKCKGTKATPTLAQCCSVTTPAVGETGLWGTDCYLLSLWASHVLAAAVTWYGVVSQVSLPSRCPVL